MSYFFDQPYAIDPAFGPSRHARFETGGAVVGCDCKKETFHTSYDETYKETQMAYPRLSDHELRVLTANIFRPRYRADIVSVRNEESGQSTEVEFEVLARGDFFYPVYGKTDTELDENAKRLNPQEHHISDTLTNQAVHEAVAQGATRVVTSYYRPGQDHRDFVEFTVDPETRKGKMRVINVGVLTGKVHFHKDMSGLTTKLFTGLRVYTPAENVFIATNKQIDHQKSEHPFRRNDPVLPEKAPLEGEVLGEVQKITRDVVVTAKNAIDYMKEKTQSSKEHPVSPTTGLRMLVTDKRYEKKFHLLKTTPDKKENDTLEQVWKEKAQEVLQISEKKAEGLLEEVFETHEAMTDAKEMIAFTADTKVAIGAALFALDFLTLTQEPQTHEAEVPFDEEALVLSEPQKKIVYSLFSSDKQFINEVPHEFEEVVNEARIDRETTFQIVNFAHMLDAIPSGEQAKKIVEEKQEIINKIELVWQKATELVRQEEKREEPQPEKQLPVAIAVWTILKLSNYLVALDHLEQFVIKRADPLLLSAIRKEKPEGLVQKEPTPWILLSIIWYLAQIREQGLTQQNVVPKKKQKKQTPIIIYAYSS